MCGSLGSVFGVAPKQRRMNGAELALGHLRQPPRLVHAPILHREVGDGEIHLQLLCAANQAVGSDGDRHARLVARNPPPPQPLRHRRRRPTPTEKVRHHIALLRGRLDDTLHQRLRLLSRVADTL
jgi:hypothetical protein